MTKAMSKPKFVILMAMIMAAGPFAVDAYLPGIPGMASDLNVSGASIASTINFYILGMALGQLIGGPLADRVEKRSLIIVGLGIFVLSCLVIASAEQIIVIKVMRVVQAVGAGFAIVCVAPLVRQKEKGMAAAKLFGTIGLIFILAPAIAPSVGALILSFGSWQHIFYFMAAYAIVIMISAATSLPKQTKRLPFKSLPLFEGYRYAFNNKTAMRYLIVQACGYSVIMVFVTNSSFIYQEHFGLTERVFALVFALNTVFNIIVNRANSYLLNRISAHVLLRIALIIQALCVVLLVVMTMMEVNVTIFAIGIIGAVGILGAIYPNTNALYISQFYKHTGSASALLGTSQFIVASIMGGITTWLHNDTLWPPILVMAGLVLITNLALPKEVKQ
ncbi:Bcr/CflA family drug resistance efflux transporter [Vibrio cholerae]|uniref:multidrug effflux MFS transporter n=1 Tax=Vibrio cholerae TaxID=666 RepID=UPI0011D5901A|nr:multidrug effflux MFS transporter [Vibrio cholerae]TXX90528.1 multidrug effflux MFS transporter [Vibrio cholerae]GHW45590.1 Bcr/CflA family drug resistance efflux transporter [Vibrio cholerae]